MAEKVEEKLPPVAPPVSVTAAPEKTGIISKTPRKSKLFILLLLAVVLLAGGITLLTFLKSRQTSSIPTPGTQSQSKKEETPTLSLSIDSPADNVVIVNNEVTIKGRTLPKMTVVAYDEIDTFSTDSDDKGNFEGKIKLSIGINSVTITAFGENGEEKSVVLDIINDSQS